MHRAFGRAVRGTCRKWRESECPVAAGEEVRRNKEDDGKKDFTPPKHSWEEAVTWTAGLVLGYQVTHHRRRNQVLFGEKPAATNTESSFVTNKSANSDASTKISTCPFTGASKVFTQPIFNLGSGNALNVKSKTTTTVIQSIDVAPFIYDHSQESDLLENSGSGRSSSFSFDEDDDDGIIFADDSGPSLVIDEVQQDAKTNPNRSSPSTSVSPPEIDSAAEYGRRFGGDLLGLLGSFEFLKAEAKATTSTKTSKKSTKKKNKNGVFGKNPPVHALDLMEKGAALGSARALYNIGVAYDRMKDIKVAKEYYKKAADLGHPLAIYNSAVLALKDGHLTEGYALMNTASEFGVPEAKSFLSPPENAAVNSQLQNLQVSDA